MGFDWPALAALSPRQWFAIESGLVERERRRDAVSEFMMGQLTAVVVNFSERGPREPMRADRFMPSRRHSVAESKGRRRVTRVEDQRIADGIRSYFHGLRNAGTPQAGEAS